MLRSCKQHPSVGCCLPFTAFRSSIGGKRTRFSHINSNAINTAQTSFALFPMLKRLFAIILTVPVLFSRLHLFAKYIVPLFYGHFLIVYLLTHFAICAPRGTTNAVLRVTIHSKIRR